MMILYRLSERADQRVLTEDEVERICAANPRDPWAVIVRLCWETGERFSVVAYIRYRHVLADLQLVCIDWRHSGAHRRVPVSTTMIEMIGSLRQGRADSDLVLGDQSWLRRNLRRLAANAGIGPFRIGDVKWQGRHLVIGAIPLDCRRATPQQERGRQAASDTTAPKGSGRFGGVGLHFRRTDAAETKPPAVERRPSPECSAVELLRRLRLHEARRGGEGDDS